MEADHGPDCYCKGCKLATAYASNRKKASATGVGVEGNASPKADEPTRPASAAPVREYGVGLCAHTDFECDCDCACPKYDGVSSHPDDYCSWPDCACGCLPECKGCAMTQEAS